MKYRIGCIPVIVVGEKKLYMLSVDRASGDIADFGGTCIFGQEESALKAKASMKSYDYLHTVLKRNEYTSVSLKTPEELSTLRFYTVEVDDVKEITDAMDRNVKNKLGHLERYKNPNAIFVTGSIVFVTKDGLDRLILGETVEPDYTHEFDVEGVFSETKPIGTMWKPIRDVLKVFID